MSEVRLTGVDSQFGGKIHQILTPEGFPITVTSTHQRIHTGNFYHVWDGADLETGDKRWVMIYTDSKTCHFTYEGTGIGRGIARLFEDAILSGTSSGTFITPYNRNRIIPNVATTRFAHTPEITSSGTQISQQSFGFDKKGGGAFGDEETVLKSDTLYLLEFESEVNSNHVDIDIDFYEVE